MRIVLLLLSLVLIFTHLNADDALQKQYKLAIQSYKAHDFSTSYKLLSKLYITKLSDVNLNFYLGRCAYETGHYEIALAAFERVQMLEPSNLRSKLEMGRTYFMLKMYEDAQLAFKEVLQNPNIPTNVRNNIELYLSKVEKVQQKSFTHATIQADWLYDSNVNYGSLDSEYNTNVGTLPATSEQSDSALQVIGDITNIYDIGEKNGFAIKNKFVAYMKDYRDMDAFDMQYISYTPSLIYSYTKHFLELAVGIDDLRLGKQNYLKSTYLIPRYQYAHTTALRSIAYFKYQRKSFQRASEYDLDLNHYELSYALQKILSPRSYIQATLTGIKEKKLHGTRIDVDYNEYRADIAYAKQFTPVYGTELSARYRKRNYADFSTLLNSTRSDDGITVGITLNAKILQTLTLHIKDTYNRVDSNQAPFTYKKNTIMLGVIKTF